MSFVEAIKTVFSKYFTFSGRALRSEFWWWVLFLTVVNLLITAIFIGSMDMSALMEDPDNFGPEQMAASSPLLIMFALFSLATIIPTLAVGSRRLHDTGKTGWLQLVFLLSIIPFLGLVVYIVMIVLFAQKGDEGENKYGPAPV